MSTALIIGIVVVILLIVMWPRHGGSLKPPKGFKPHATGYIGGGGLIGPGGTYSGHATGYIGGGGLIGPGGTYAGHATGYHGGKGHHFPAHFHLPPLPKGVMPVIAKW